VGAQLGRHDVEQAGIDAEDGDQRFSIADIPEHAERVATELLDAEQHQLRITQGEHVGAIDPALVELERLRIGRADHRAVRTDEADVLHGGALIDVEADRLERGGSHVASPRPASSSRLAAAKSTANSDRRSTTSVSLSSWRAC
jgi:hypothetical protein